MALKAIYKDIYTSWSAGRRLAQTHLLIVLQCTAVTWQSLCQASDLLWQCNNWKYKLRISTNRFQRKIRTYTNVKMTHFFMSCYSLIYVIQFVYLTRRNSLRSKISQDRQQSNQLDVNKAAIQMKQTLIFFFQIYSNTDKPLSFCTSLNILLMVSFSLEMIFVVFVWLLKKKKSLPYA